MFIAPLQLVLLLSPLALAALVKRAPHDSNENLIWTGGAGEAKFGERPHVCAILKWEQTDTDPQPLKIYQGGASLIDDGIVLTAAHLIHDLVAADLLVRCAEWKVNVTGSEDEKFPHQERQVVAIVRHPDSAGKHKNSFAILFLEGVGIEAMPHIAPVLLPPPCAVYNIEENCVVNGWGKDKCGDDGRYATIMKEIDIPLVGRNECQKTLRTTLLGRFFELDRSFICAGGIAGVGLGVFKGDGGSPLICKIQEGTNSWVQAGIALHSRTIGCGEGGIPQVFANVRHVVCWIDDEVEKYFVEESSRFGFLQEIDCDGPEPRQNCG